MKNKIFNIPATCSFVDVLAEKFLAEYQDKRFELVDVLFLMPNRRSCNSLRDAFVRAKGLEPTMLPRIIPIGDVDEESFLFSSAVELSDYLPAISSLERILIFINEILKKSENFGVEKMTSSQACFLAHELASLIDGVNYENLSFENLKDLVPEEYATHWLETLNFLEIITKKFPEILKEKKEINPSERYNQMLYSQCEIWEKEKTTQRIVVAGTMASFPVIKKVLNTVLQLSNGEFYINGLDRYLDFESFEKIEETHPEFEISNLLKSVGVERNSVKDVVSPKNISREILVSEIMRPAQTTDKWLEIRNRDISIEAWGKLLVIEAPDSRGEALVIAILMREALESPEKTTALVTSDRNLARRVSNELERWDIKVDDSAGKPLSLTPLGMFFRLIAKVLENDFDVIDLLSLLKHPFMSFGKNLLEFKRLVKDFEMECFRKQEFGKSSIKNLPKDLGVISFIEGIKKEFEPLLDILAKEKIDLREALECHIKLATKFATTDEVDGNEVLWRGEVGKVASAFFAGLYEKISVLGEVPKGEYLNFLESLMSFETVRQVFGTHPRLKILGPIEARLFNFDRVIIGSLNEGIWPKFSTVDPWMSRPMKKDFGMSSGEKKIGVMAKDFASLLSSPEVFITRAIRVDGTPMVKSRWLMRLETVISAMGIPLEKIEDRGYLQLALSLDAAKVSKKIEAPAPTPPLFARPRKLSVSGIESLMLDPYVVFARYILKLYPLKKLKEDLLALDYGNIIHEVLENFNKKYPSGFPETAKEELLSMGNELFSENRIVEETKAFWLPKFEKTVDWLVKVEKKYRKVVKKVHSEIEGKMTIKAPLGDFTITAKVDRIDEIVGGKLNIIDYKTGQAKSIKQVETGYAPQLPIEGLIAREGGFSELIDRRVNQLIYWKLADKEIVIEKDIDDVLNSNFRNITELIFAFDDLKMSYISKPANKYENKNRDYDHLARVLEWSISGEDDDE